jgi:hypothetical protein
MDPPLPDGGAAIVGELVAMLDALDPEFADRERSRIAVEGRFRGDRTLALQIAHRHDGSATVEVMVSRDGAVVAWLGAHEHIDPSGDSTERPWSSTVADVVAAAMRGEYAVESLRRGGRVVRRRILDDVRGGACISETGSLLAWLPLGRRATESRRLDFGVRG